MIRELAQALAEIVEWAETISAHTWLLRVALFTASLVTIATCASQGNTLSGTVTVVGVLVAVVAAVSPESRATGVLQLGLGVWCVVTVPMSWLTVLVAAEIAVIQACATAAALGPVQTRLPATVVSRLVTRNGTYVLASAAAATTVAVLTLLPSARWLAVAGAVILLVAVVAVTMSANRVPPPEDVDERIVDDGWADSLARDE